MTRFKMIPGGRKEITKDEAAEASPMRLVLIDDDVIDAKMLSKTMEARSRVEFEQYTNALAAEHLWTGQPTVRPQQAFLIDLEMPRMNGFELVETIRAALPVREQPLLIAYSGCLASIEPDRLSSFDGAFEKPMSMAGISEMVDNILEMIESRQNESSETIGCDTEMPFALAAGLN